MGRDFSAPGTPVVPPSSTDKKGTPVESTPTRRAVLSPSSNGPTGIGPGVPCGAVVIYPPVPRDRIMYRRARNPARDVAISAPGYARRKQNRKPEVPAV